MVLEAIGTFGSVSLDVSVAVEERSQRGPREVRLWGTRMDEMQRVENNWASAGHPSRRLGDLPIPLGVLRLLVCRANTNGQLAGEEYVVSGEEARVLDGALTLEGAKDPSPSALAVGRPTK